MPAIYPSSAWREFRGKPNLKTLNDGAIHFAIVKDVHGKDRKCAVKLINLKKGPGLACEAIGWLLAGACGVNVPAFACILRVPLAKLGLSMTLPDFVKGESEYLAWCVEIVEGKAISQVNKWIFWLALKNCLAAKNTPVIASFDYWADNADRNFGNVIKSKDGQYVAIDHEALLHDLLYKPRGITFKLNSLLQCAQQDLSSKKLLRFKCDMATAASLHANAQSSVSADILIFLTRLLPDASQAAYVASVIDGYLKPRAQLGWMSQELGVTI